MKLIESSVEYLPQEEGLDGVYKQIELAGRTCYKSEDRITKDSAEGFVEKMVKSHHTAMLEHGTVYLTMRDTFYSGGAVRYGLNEYSKVNKHNGKFYITTNYRVITENNFMADMLFQAEPTEYHEKRYTFKFTTDRGVSHELVRSRKFSFAQESQRYCGYDKGKFGGELTFIMPSWYKNHEVDSFKMNQFDKILEDIEKLYMYYRECDMQPQQARAILSNTTKTTIVMTGFASDWRYLLDLRLFEKTGKVHPDMLDLMQKTQKAMQEAGIWEDIMKYPSKFE